MTETAVGFTVENIINAYKEFNIPARYDYLIRWHRQDICVGIHPLIILCLAHLGGQEIRTRRLRYIEDYWEMIGTIFGFPLNKVIGLYDASLLNSRQYSSTDYIEGYRLGKAIRTAVDLEIEKGNLRTR